MPRRARRWPRCFRGGAAGRHRLRLGTALRRGGRQLRARVLGLEIDTSAAMIVPDVMIGAAELLRLLTDEGGPAVVSPPVYDSFFGFVDAIGRRRIDAPLTPAGRLDPEALRTAFREATAGGERRHTCCATRRTRPGRSTPRRAGVAGVAGRGARGARRRRRDPRAGRVRRRPGLHALPHRARRRARVLGLLAVEGLEPRRAEVGAGHGRGGCGRRLRSAARGQHARLVAPRGDRPRRGDGRWARLAGPAGRRARRQPGPARAAAGRAPARRAVAGAGGDLPRVARLP